MANIELKDAPATAFAIAIKIAQVVKTLEGRPTQVATVKGLNRNLFEKVSIAKDKFRIANAAVIARLLHLLSFLGEVNSLEETASPELEILDSAFALHKSTIMYRI
ncbi:hypothetical protein BGHDH14_bgh05328 [Blumeria hordei DH14]|uniref:Uncharacterized protein n=1 Tax=Blumeria graminis f. sp. hordei (strain DH14) TaxID=546991 RepID=N1JAI2_BLUG1|nr:hypothetical protein BGHDH14_bgh05328 [Blumeria hordei DH14]